MDELIALVAERMPIYSAEATSTCGGSPTSVGLRPVGGGRASLSFPVKRWPLRRGDRDLLRRGPSVPKYNPAALKRVRPIEVYEGEELPGTGGMAYQYSKKTVVYLTARMRQQGWTEAECFRELMKPRNVSGLWLRRQDDPEAAMSALWAHVVAEARPGLLPYLPMTERDRRILLLTGAGVASQKAIVAQVGHANEGAVRQDLRRMVESGALTVEAAKHGKVTWYSYALAVAKAAAWDLALETRKALQRKLARLEALRKMARRKGCKGLPEGEAHGNFLPINKDEQIRAEPVKHELDRLMADLMGDWWTADKPKAPSPWAVRHAILDHQQQIAIDTVVEWLGDLDVNAPAPPTWTGWTGAAARHRAMQVLDDALHPAEARARRYAISNIYRFTRRSTTFLARYSGWCRVCGGEYEAGESVFFVGDGADSGRAHAACAEWCRSS